MHNNMTVVESGNSLMRVESGCSSTMMLVVVINRLAGCTSVMMVALKRLDALLTNQPSRSSLDITVELADTPALRHFSIRQPPGHQQSIPIVCLRSP
jgi:hypothetical protein